MAYKTDMYAELLAKIREYHDITIFRHQRPDGDAVFSALAMYRFIKDNFKDKTVKIAGNDAWDRLDISKYSHKVSNSFIERSLAIIVDTATLQRCDDERAHKAAYIIKIDHHPPLDNYGDLNIVDPKAASCTQLLSQIFMSAEFSELTISADVYEYLYSGLITDSINFSTVNTTPETMRVAAILAEKGKFKISDLFVRYMNDDLDTFTKLTKLRNYLKVKDHFGYIKLYEKDLEKIGFTAAQAKQNINEIGKIIDLNIWALAVRTEGGFDCSVRSKRGYKINDICASYGGGGHDNAAAAKNLKPARLKQLFTELVELSTKPNM